MDKFIIEANRDLSGKIYVDGAKNAILPAMATCLLAPGKSRLTNVPSLIDLKSMAHLMRVIGARVEYENVRCILIVKMFAILKRLMNL